MVIAVQKKKSIKDLLLVLVCAHNGEYTWYQLARELEWRGLSGMGSVVKLANLLIDEALVTQKMQVTVSKDTPVYFVTDRGREKAKDLVEQYGLDSFKIKKQNPDDYVVE